MLTRNIVHILRDFSWLPLSIAAYAAVKALREDQISPELIWSIVTFYLLIDMFPLNRHTCIQALRLVHGFDHSLSFDKILIVGQGYQITIGTWLRHGLVPIVSRWILRREGTTIFSAGLVKTITVASATKWFEGVQGTLEWTSASSILRIDAQVVCF